MRVIAGEFKGRVLRTPRGGRTRPTQGQVRQVLFDLLGPAIQGANFLDLFSGSGAVGLEALSRGAEAATLVERSPGPLQSLRANVATLGVEDRCRILAVPVEAGLRALADGGETFGIVFADPPYRSQPRDWMGRLEQSGPGRLLADDGMLILEASRRAESVEAIGRLSKSRRHPVGDTVLEFYRWGRENDEAEGNLSRNL